MDKQIAQTKFENLVSARLEMLATVGIEPDTDYEQASEKNEFIYLGNANVNVLEQQGYATDEADIREIRLVMEQFPEEFEVFLTNLDKIIDVAKQVVEKSDGFDEFPLELTQITQSILNITKQVKTCKKSLDRYNQSPIVANADHYGASIATAYNMVFEQSDTSYEGLIAKIEETIFEHEEFEDAMHEFTHPVKRAEQSQTARIVGDIKKQLNNKTGRG